MCGARGQYMLGVAPGLKCVFFFFSSLGQSWVNNVLFVPRVEWGRRRGCAHLCREGPQGWRPLNEEGAGRQKVLTPNPSSAVRPAIIFTSAA